MADCAHQDFEAVVDVHRLEDEPGKVRAFLADVRIRCAQCGRQFQFLGLDQGLDIGGAAVSFDRTEAHLTISPDGLPPGKGVRGFSIKHSGGSNG
jgi:hypothetical protein